MSYGGRHPYDTNSRFVLHLFLACPMQHECYTPRGHRQKSMIQIMMHDACPIQCCSCDCVVANVGWDNVSYRLWVVSLYVMMHAPSRVSYFFCRCMHGSKWLYLSRAALHHHLYHTVGLVRLPPCIMICIILFVRQERLIAFQDT